MDTTPGTIGWLLARELIHDRIARIARGEDRRDAALVAQGYWPDAVTDFGIFDGDFDAYLAWIVPGSTAVLNTQHLIGQSLIEIDGDAARVETHVMSYHRVDMGSEMRDLCIGGRYLDMFARRGDDWRIAKRTMLYDWAQDWGVSADWSRGLMGTPFRDDRFTGRANGDHSQEFFA